MEWRRGRDFAGGDFPSTRDRLNYPLFISITRFGIGWRNLMTRDAKERKVDDWEEEEACEKRTRR